MAPQEDSALVVEAKKIPVQPVTYSYTEAFSFRDVILYNLGIGATETDLQWVYEGDDEFQAIPTFGVIPQFHASGSVPLDWLPDFNPAKLLHGEQFLSIKAPIPTSGDLVSTARLLEVLDKGKAAASTVFIRGSGGFGGPRTGTDRGAATAENARLNVPRMLCRRKDYVFPSRAVPVYIYFLNALSGDGNPLHILPEFAAIGGFNKPILHGLCSMGIAGKHVFQKFGAYKDIKIRRCRIPWETLVTEMWKEGQKVIFTTKVKERDTVV
ncbi:HotDog domain-containing protein [Mycena galopus ATCC 62051]|nr:HotDog domain-containing protein [Mycena galopus ATCC 62051]